MSRILVVEDNAELAAGMEMNLQLEGYEVLLAEDVASGLEVVRNHEPDLIVLDLMLPGPSGFELLRTLREEGDATPVLILTALGDEVNRVRGFRLEADQYMTKPFSLVELLTRVRSLLRRYERGTDQPLEQIRFGAVEVDPLARTVFRCGERVHLSPKEFDLLVALIRNAGKAMSRFELLKEVWGHRRPISTRTVDSHVAELRRKLEADPSDPVHIQTVWKVGYRFEY